MANVAFRPPPAAVLFLSPVFPSSEGSGPGRRAHAVMSALARRHRVDLLVLTAPYADEQVAVPLPAGCELLGHIPSTAGHDRELFFRRWLARRFPRLSAIGLARPPDWLDHTAARLRLAARTCAGRSYDVIHAFRLATAPYALAIHAAVGNAPALHLDLDDIESLTRRRIAELHALRGETRFARRESLNAAAYERRERRLLPRFQRVYLCSRIDAGRMRGACADTRVLPNIASVPARRPSLPADDACFRLLFIGSLGYVPNHDGVHWFCEQVLPRLRAIRRCELLVAGHAGSPEFERYLRSRSGVRFLGCLERAENAYHDAHAAIVPLRAGGGTRLKLLEAFAQGRPAVCTGIGAEGIDAVPGRHYLRADTADEFARACLRLAADPDLRESLADAAHGFVGSRHTPASLDEALL